MRDWSKVTLETDPCVGYTRQAVLDFTDTVMLESKRLSKAGMYTIENLFSILMMCNVADSICSPIEELLARHFQDM